MINRDSGLSNVEQLVQRAAQVGAELLALYEQLNEYCFVPGHILRKCGYTSDTVIRLSVEGNPEESNMAPANIVADVYGLYDPSDDHEANVRAVAEMGSGMNPDAVASCKVVTLEYDGSTGAYFREHRGGGWDISAVQESLELQDRLGMLEVDESEARRLHDLVVATYDWTVATYGFEMAERARQPEIRKLAFDASSLVFASTESGDDQEIDEPGRRIKCHTRLMSVSVADAPRIAEFVEELGGSVGEIAFVVECSEQIDFADHDEQLLLDSDDIAAEQPDEHAATLITFGLPFQEGNAPLVQVYNMAVLPTGGVWMADSLVDVLSTTQEGVRQEQTPGIPLTKRECELLQKIVDVLREG